jgi:hypothetical protein
MKRLHVRPLWALAFAAGVGCAPAANAPSDVTPLPVAERTVELRGAPVVLPREDQRFDVAALEPAVRDAVVRVRGVRTDTAIEYVDDSEFFSRARTVLQRLYTPSKLKITDSFLAREWLAFEDADRIVARREVRGLAWSPHLIATHLATALVEPGLSIREADLGAFYNHFRHGVAWFYGGAAANVIAGTLPHRALLRSNLTRDTSGYGSERAYFGPASNTAETGVSAIASSQRFWEEASRDFAHALYTIGGNRLVEAALKDPPTTLRELSNLGAYAASSPASTLVQTDGGQIEKLGATFTAGSLGIVQYAGSIAAGELAFLAKKGGHDVPVVVAEFFRETPPDLSALTKNEFVRQKSLPNGNMLVAISDDSVADADAVLALIKSIPGTPRRRWSYAPDAVAAVDAGTACGYSLVDGRQHSNCSSVEYPKSSQAYNAHFRPLSPLDLTAYLLRALALPEADRRLPLLLPDGARSVRIEQRAPNFGGRITATCGGIASSEVLSGAACEGEDCKAVAQATAAILAVAPPEDVPTFCAELAYEQSHDLPEPQIPPGLLVARP